VDARLDPGDPVDRVERFCLNRVGGAGTVRSTRSFTLTMTRVPEAWPRDSRLTSSATSSPRRIASTAASSSARSAPQSSSAPSVMSPEMPEKQSK
jgi:hypothetical protein